MYYSIEGVGNTEDNVASKSVEFIDKAMYLHVWTWPWPSPHVKVHRFVDELN